MTPPLRHLLISYHTCPAEQPGQDLAGGMNVLLKGFLERTTLETDVVTRSFGGYQRQELRPGVVIHRLPCGATRPWTRDKAFEALDTFAESFRHWSQGRTFHLATAHYWMSGRLLRQLRLPAAIMFHTLQAQKGPAKDQLERSRLAEEARLIASYPCAFLHWHDLHNARRHYPHLKGTVVRPGCAFPLGSCHRPEPPPWIFGWAARSDAIKNFEHALELLDRLRSEGLEAQLRVAGMVVAKGLAGTLTPGMAAGGGLIALGAFANAYLTHKTAQMKG